MSDEFTSPKSVVTTSDAVTENGNNAASSDIVSDTVIEPSKQDYAAARSELVSTYSHKLALYTHFTVFGPPLTVAELQSHIRARMYAAVSCSAHNGGSYVWSVIMTLLIVSSFICILIQSFPAYRLPDDAIGDSEREGNDIMDDIQLAIVIAFTIEFGIRLLTVDAYVHVQQFALPYERRASLLYIWYKFFTRLFNIIDVASIVPYYFVLFGYTDDSFAIIRILRIIRLLLQVELIQVYTSRPIMMFIVVMTKSADVFSLMIVYLLVGMVLFGTLIFYAESGSYDNSTGFFMRPTVTGDTDGTTEVTPFSSIPQSFWWVIVTMSTVGYGDLYPTSAGGKTVAGICIIAGIMYDIAYSHNMIAMPISIIGANFTNEYSDEKKLVDERAQVIRQQRLEGGDAHPGGLSILSRRGLISRVRRTVHEVRSAVNTVGSVGSQIVSNVASVGSRRSSQADASAPTDIQYPTIVQLQAQQQQSEMQPQIQPQPVPEGVQSNSTLNQV